MPAGSVALVTGGSRGIGRATAIRLARDHGNVAVSYRSARAAAEEVAAEVEGAGAECQLLEVDLVDARAGHDLVAQVLERFGRLDVVVNNAGIAERRDLLSMDVESWERTIAVNLSSVFGVLQAAAQAMMGGGGSIVNVGSPAASNGGITGPHYAAAKAGLVGLTASAARSLAPHQIRVNLVEPAFVETDMVLGLVHDDPSLQLLSPLGRRGRPDEAAEAIAFLCSPAASYVSGARLSVSGAAT